MTDFKAKMHQNRFPHKNKSTSQSSRRVDVRQTTSKLCGVIKPLLTLSWQFVRCQRVMLTSALTRGDFVPHSQHPGCLPHRQEVHEWSSPSSPTFCAWQKSLEVGQLRICANGHDHDAKTIAPVVVASVWLIRIAWTLPASLRLRIPPRMRSTSDVTRSTPTWWPRTTTVCTRHGWMTSTAVSCRIRAPGLPDLHSVSVFMCAPSCLYTIGMSLLLLWNLRYFVASHDLQCWLYRCLCTMTLSVLNVWIGRSVMNISYR